MSSLTQSFLKAFKFEPTACQTALFEAFERFAASEESDIMIVNGYAGTGKTSAVSAIVSTLVSMRVKTVLLAPTGRSAKVFSAISGRPAYTVHKHIYKQKGVGENGYGQFSMAPNKGKGVWYFVDEVSLIGIGSERSVADFGSGNLLDDLVQFVRSGVGCRLVLIGDSAQLPPIGLEASPALYPDYMSRYGNVCSCTLSTVVRQALESGILRCATMLRERIETMMPDSGVDDLKMTASADMERVSGAELLEKLEDAYSRYGEDEVIVLTRTNKRAIRYNLGIRSKIQFKEERLVRGERLMIVRNCYQFLEDVKELEYIANGDIAVLERIGKYEDRYGLHFAEARLSFPDYDDVTIDAKVLLDTLDSDSPSLSYEQQEALYRGVSEDYSHIRGKKARYDAVREDPFYNALQLKYADAITCHKSQGGQWKCVFIDCPFWMDEQSLDDLKWLYTALTRSREQVYLVNFPDRFFPGL